MGIMSVLALGSQMGDKAYGWQHGYAASFRGNEEKGCALA